MRIRSPKERRLHPRARDDRCSPRLVARSWTESANWLRGDPRRPPVGAYRRRSLDVNRPLPVYAAPRSTLQGGSADREPPRGGAVCSAQRSSKARLTPRRDGFHGTIPAPPPVD